MELVTTSGCTAHAAARFSFAWEEEPVPFQEKITIERNTQEGSAGAVFEPDPLEIGVLDQICWTNRDSEPHWPGLVKDDGIDETFFMPNQIAPNGDSSPTFSPSTAGTFEYACSLHQGETGTINVK